jgi:carboxyl-terminal processing protease
VRRALVPLLVLAALAAGITLGGHPDALPGFVRDTLVGDGDTRVVREAIEKVNDDYYRSVPQSKLADAAIAGIVKSLDDRFSNYLDAKAYNRFQKAGDPYEGVGMEVLAVKRGLRVVATYDGSPARRAGIRAGDVIVAVNGHSLAGASSSKGSTMIKGKPGTEVRLSVQTGRKVRVLKVDRATVTVPVVASSLRTVAGKKLGVVRLATFETTGAHAQVIEALKKLLARGAKGFVLDLRDNGGGLLNEAVLVSSIFIPEGKIVTTRGRSRPEHVFDATGSSIDTKIPVAVLVNGESASASEIVTGALQDRHRATVVGTRTFGKGVFQEIKQLSNGGALDITVGEYFTPSGRNLGGGGPKKGAGITPDVKARDNSKTKRDEALDVAVRTAVRGHA